MKLTEHAKRMIRNATMGGGAARYVRVLSVTVAELRRNGVLYE